MAIDIVKPLKIENPATGGTQTDVFPTEVTPTQDYIAAKGIAFDGLATKTVDTDVSGNIKFTDVNYTDIKLTTVRTPDKFFFAEAIAEQSNPNTTAVNALTLTINQAIPAGKYKIEANWQYLATTATTNFNGEFYMTVAAVKTTFMNQLEVPFNGANYPQNAAWTVVTLPAQNANNVVIKFDFWRTVGVGIARVKNVRLSFYRISD